MKTRTAGQDITLEKLSDKELLRRLDILNQKERETTLSVLLHLNEVERIFSGKSGANRYGMWR